MGQAINYEIGAEVLAVKLGSGTTSDTDEIDECFDSLDPRSGIRSPWPPSDFGRKDSENGRMPVVTFANTCSLFQETISSIESGVFRAEEAPRRCDSATAGSCGSRPPAPSVGDPIEGPQHLRRDLRAIFLKREVTHVEEVELQVREITVVGVSAFLGKI